jgi:hypothetical protein
VGFVNLGKSKCPLCGNVLAKGEQLRVFPHFIVDEADPLWRYSDAGMHLACFRTWDQREAFVGKFNARSTIVYNGKRRQMNDDGRIYEEPVSAPESAG